MREKIKLVVLLGGFAMGGAEHMVYELVKNIDQTMFDVTVMCTFPKQNTDLEHKVEQICDVRHLGEEGRVGVGAIYRVVKALKQMKPDVVHAHMGGSGFAAMWSILYRKPLVITVHTKPEKAFSKKIESLVKMALHFDRTKLVAVSEDNAAKVKAYYGLDGRKIECVNNGIDVARFFHKEHGSFTLINVARHDENKNQAALIRCFDRLHKEYDNTMLFLLGDGETHRALINQANDLGLSDSVIFTGNVANTEDYYAVSDVYLQSSHREAMPLSVLEAMAAGLPIVSTDVGGLRDVVQDNGILVEDNDEEALYQAILKIYKQSAEETKKMSDASLRIVQSYSAESMARAYEKIYQEML